MQLTTIQTDKKEFVEGVLAALLKEAYNCSNKISDVTYEAFEADDSEFVYVELEPTHEDGVERIIKVDVTADSLSAIVTDVVRVMNDQY